MHAYTLLPQTCNRRVFVGEHATVCMFSDKILLRSPKARIRLVGLWIIPISCCLLFTRDGHCEPTTPESDAGHPQYTQAVLPPSPQHTHTNSHASTARVTRNADHAEQQLQVPFLFFFHVRIENSGRRKLKPSISRSVLFIRVSETGDPRRGVGTMRDTGGIFRQVPRIS